MTTAPSCLTCQNSRISYYPASYWEPADATCECNLAWQPEPPFPSMDIYFPDYDIMMEFGTAAKCDSYIPIADKSTIESLNALIFRASNWTESIGNMLCWLDTQQEQEYCPDFDDAAAEYYVELGA